MPLLLKMLVDSRRRDVFYLVAALLGVALYVLTAGGGFPLDDSWIHQVYARNLAERGEWSFIPGEPSAASTSPLYTLILAVGYTLNAPYVLWTHLVGALTLAAAAMLAARMTQHLMPERPLVAFSAGLAVLLTWHLLWAAASGMETMLFSAFTLLLIWRVWRETELDNSQLTLITLRGALFGAASAGIVLTRPEGLMLAGLCGIAVLVVRPQGDMRRAVLWSVGAAGAFLVCITPYLLLNLSLTGGLLPATADAKFAQHAPLLALPFSRRLLQMLVPILAGGQILLLPGLVVYGILLIRWRKEGRAALLYSLPLLWGAALIFIYAARLPASYQHGRYVIPVLPSLMMAGVVGLAYALTWSRRSITGRVLIRSLALSAAVALAYFGIVLGPTVYRQDVRIIEEEMVAPARWIADNLPLEDLLAIHDIGAVGYFAPRPILDIAGLINMEVVAIVRDADALWALMQARDARYLMAFPDQIPGYDEYDNRLCPVFRSDGSVSLSAGGPKMTVYRLAWDGVCPS